MNVRFLYPINFRAAIYYDGQLQMNEYMIKIYMQTTSPDQADSNTAFSRIRHFVYNELENTIFINGNTDIDRAKELAKLGLNITTIPGEPVDQLIGIMLYYKISAIVEERLLVGEIEITSALGEGLVYLHGENETINDVVIPDWWNAADLVHCDSELIDNDKVVTMHRGSVWRELDLQWPDIEDNSDTGFEDEEELGNTVVFADFKKPDETK